MIAESEDACRLRERFASADGIAADGASCPPPELLWRAARNELDRQENESVIAHFAGCPACAAAWRMARDLKTTRAEIHGPPSAGVPFHRRNWAMAVAAGVVLAVVGFGIYLLPTSQKHEPAFRAQEVVEVLPLLDEGAVLARSDCVLRWTPGPSDTTYDVYVTSEDLDPLARGQRIRRPEFRVSPGVLENLPPGARIHWRVTAHLPDGRRVASRTFTTPIE